MTDKPGRTAPSDAYEAEHMPGAGKVLYRDKVIARAMALLLLTLAVGMGALGVTSLGGAPAFVPWMVFAGALLVGACGLGLSVLRTVVTSEEVHVQYGLWGPRVPIDAITSCRVIDYDWAKFGGWGIKRAMDGTRAYTLSAGGHVVELGWTDENGKAKKVVFSAENPDAVVAKILGARSMRAVTATGFRVETTDEAERSPDAEVAALADQQLEAKERATTTK